MVCLCGELERWRGRGKDGLEWGPPHYPESYGPGSEEGVGRVAKGLGARLWVMGLKEGSTPHDGTASHQNIYSLLPLIGPCTGWNAGWQWSHANLLTHIRIICRCFVKHSTMHASSWHLQEIAAVLISPKSSRAEKETAMMQCCKKQNYSKYLNTTVECFCHLGLFGCTEIWSKTKRFNYYHQSLK